jgi:hypothetical protein
MSDVMGITSGGELADIFGNPTQPPAPPSGNQADTETRQEENNNDSFDRLAALFAQQREMQQIEMEAATQMRRDSARSVMLRILADYGLESLTDYTFNEIIANPRVDISNPDAIIFALREQPAYQERFAANKDRAAAGLPELDPASYIALEEQYRTVIRANGLPPKFYDQTDDFRELIRGDVSPSELQSRVEQGFRAVDDADPEVLNQLRRFYPEIGQSREQLAAYFLDPEKAAPIITRNVRAAQIAARGREQGGIQISSQLAEDLARRGITESEAQKGFAEIGALGELAQTFAGETALSSEQLVGATFDVDTAAKQELERRRKLRTAAFQGGGSFTRTTGETSGSIRTGIGEAQ